MIREAKLQDAAILLDLVMQVEKESDYMLMDPGERKTTVDDQEKMIKAFVEKENATILLAELNGQLVGYLIVNGGDVNRKRHSAYLVIGIAESHRGKGIGTALFSEMDGWARSIGIHRLELTTAVENEAGIRLYKKAGFEIEGTKRHSLRVDGRYVDEYYMGKLLD